MQSRKLPSMGLIFYGDSTLPSILEGGIESPYFFVTKGGLCGIGTCAPATGGAWERPGAVSKAGSKVGALHAIPRR